MKEGQDSKGRATLTATFGLKADQNGVEVNTLDDLIAALEPLRGKQANITFHIEEQESQGRKFLTGFARVTEMIPRDQGGGPQGGQSRFTPKNQQRNTNVKATAQKIRQNFAGTSDDTEIPF